MQQNATHQTARKSGSIQRLEKRHLIPENTALIIDAENIPTRKFIAIIQTIFGEDLRRFAKISAFYRKDAPITPEHFTFPGIELHEVNNNSKNALDQAVRQSALALAEDYLPTDCGARAGRYGTIFIATNNGIAIKIIQKIKEYHPSTWAGIIITHTYPAFNKDRYLRAGIDVLQVEINKNTPATAELIAERLQLRNRLFLFMDEMHQKQIKTEDAAIALKKQPWYKELRKNDLPNTIRHTIKRYKHKYRTIQKPDGRYIEPMPASPQ